MQLHETTDRIMYAVGMNASIYSFRKVKDEKVSLQFGLPLISALKQINSAHTVMPFNQEPCYYYNPR